jgi:hypothetical protein
MKVLFLCAKLFAFTSFSFVNLDVRGLEIRYIKPYLVSEGATKIIIEDKIYNIYKSKQDAIEAEEKSLVKYDYKIVYIISNTIEIPEVISLKD